MAQLEDVHVSPPRRGRPEAIALTSSPTPATALPPGPTAPRLVQTLRFVRDPFGFAAECARRYGDCFTTRLLGFPPGVAFSDPTSIKEIFSGDPDDFLAGESNRRLLEPILGEHSLLVLDGERHLRERRLLAPPLHGERMHVYGEIMREITDRVIAGWPIGRPFALQHEMQRITLEIILHGVFGVEDAAQDRMRAALLRFLALAERPSAAFIAIPATQVELGGLTPWGRFVRRRAAVDALLYAEIARRRTEGTAGRTDILSLLVEARDEEGRGMGDRELRDEMFTLLMAGHETTATSLAWVFYHVLTRPEVLERVRAELAAVVGDGPLAPRHVPQLHYLDAVIKETARVNPVVDWAGRLLRRPKRIGGWNLPAGTLVMVSSYLAHHRADGWGDPERFRPDRFVDARPSPYAYFPFGGGVRRCIGAAFASYEMKIVLAEVLPRVELRVAPGYRPRVVRRAVTLGPRKGVPVVVTGRGVAVTPARGAPGSVG